MLSSFNLFTQQDLVHYLTNFIPLSSILLLASSSSRIYELISKDERFWEIKCRKDFKTSVYNIRDTDFIKTLNWKSFYIINSTQVISFGNNDKGQLGSKVFMGIHKPKIMSSFKFKDISISKHGISIGWDDRVWCWGDNKDGKLGLGITRGIQKPSLLKLENNIYARVKCASTGSKHSAIIDVNNNVWTFGNNHSGQLGLEDKNNRNRPNQIIGFKAQQVSCGEFHIVIIDMNNNVWTCGSNYVGQLGLNDRKDRDILTQILGLKAKQVSAGSNHTILIDLDDNIWTFGENNYGQLGLGHTNNIKVPTQIITFISCDGQEIKARAKQVSAGHNHTTLIDLEDNAWTFGDSRFGQLGLGEFLIQNSPNKIPNLKAKQISAGDYHTGLIDTKNNVWMFGCNRSGQLGLDDNEGKNTPIQISDIKAKKISAGKDTTVIIKIL